MAFMIKLSLQCSANIISVYSSISAYFSQNILESERHLMPCCMVSSFC
jgi:hypothetical protein